MLRCHFEQGVRADGRVLGEYFRMCSSTAGKHVTFIDQIHTTAAGNAGYGGVRLVWRHAWRGFEWGV